MAGRSGCTAFIAEIDQSETNLALIRQRGFVIVQACDTHDLILIVNQCLTTIYRGAQLVYQLEAYAGAIPDFVPS